MYTIKFLAPILMMGCVNNFIEGQGEYCNLDQTKPHVVKYYEPEKSCYRDGIFYPRCKDLENPEVLHYHNMFLNK